MVLVLHQVDLNEKKKADLLTLSERLDQLYFCASAEVPDIHLGWKDAAALEETGEFQAGAAQRYTSKRGDCSRAEGRGRMQEELNERSCIVPLSRAPS